MCNFTNGIGTDNVMTQITELIIAAKKKAGIRVKNILSERPRSCSPVHQNQGNMPERRVGARCRLQLGAHASGGSHHERAAVVATASRTRDRVPAPIGLPGCGSLAQVYIFRAASCPQNPVIIIDILSFSSKGKLIPRSNIGVVVIGSCFRTRLNRVYSVLEFAICIFSCHFTAGCLLARKPVSAEFDDVHLLPTIPRHPVFTSLNSRPSFII